MKKCVKRIFCIGLILIMIFAVMPLTPTSVDAASYNSSSAVAFANSHWNTDSSWLCAEFVSRCLGAGGISIPNRASYYSSSTQSYQNNSGTLGVYTNPYTCSAPLLLYLSKYYPVITNPSSSQISVGDVVFMYSGEWKDGHVGIVISTNGGTPIYAAHNRATNTGRFSSSYPCTYVVKMGGALVTHTVDTSYGTNFTAYPKAKITAGNIFDAYHNQIDSTSWIGTVDKCTIHEVYTDGCCKVTYPLDAGGTKTVYSKISLFNTHTHSYTGTRVYETAHPHRISQRCVDYATCGGWVWTDEYYELKTCEQCWHADLDIGASSILIKVGESKTVSVTLSGCLPDSVVALQSFSPDNDVVEVTVKSQQATFTGLKAGTTNYSITVYSDSSKSHLIGKVTIPITVTAQTYTVTYSANGGAGAPSSQTKNHGTALTLSSTVPTRFGYNFIGWATSSSATSASYQPGGSYSSNSNVTLYAVWQQAASLSTTTSTSTTAAINYGGVGKYYKFTPSVTASYRIYGTGSVDNKVVLYNSSGTQLATDDDSGESTQFQLDYTLTAGQTYYIYVRLYSSSATGSVPFSISRGYTVTYNANNGSGVPAAAYKCKTSPF